MLLSALLLAISVYAYRTTLRKVAGSLGSGWRSRVCLGGIRVRAFLETYGVLGGPGVVAGLVSWKAVHMGNLREDDEER